MKKILLFLFAFTYVFCAPTICLNMIVKNESKVIERSLSSVKPYIDYWVIVDTGSTDGTQEIIKKFMKGVPGELYERPWINFSHNRNEALQLARPKADYLLFIDADDILTYSDGFHWPNLERDSYSMNIQYGNLFYARTQLIKSSLDWRWEGVVHEALVSSQAASKETLNGVTMVIVGGGDRSNDPEKYLKDAKMLEAALETDPNHTRNMFYLAQSYRDAQKPELAIKYYNKRVQMGGWDQEVFWSLYQIAKIQEGMNVPEETLFKSYYDAFQYRPSRIEPLFRLAQYYRFKKNYFLGYLVSKHGLEIPRTNDYLFVESSIYDYDLLLEYSICAYWIGKYKESYQASSRLLENEHLPQNVIECVQKNLKFALDKLTLEN